MRIRSLALLSLCLPSLAATAQTASDQWTTPAPAASIATAHDFRSQGDDAAAKPSPFKFKAERKTWEEEPPPPRANDQNAVMGTERPWQNGQPPVSCAQTPHDPACH
ncbi:hypothetical protein IHE49_08775 [Rhodanobacter sp. 7MK24]|uniref:hypothetical protein n=1 Tax=Rhodanobacter sp. 7MK24 TaxID=2775922 RepID=UPI001782AC9F|nr:hypothetical protein [Rhodanobacter sp. 7MK24]MBD8880576.1 hypothetical protein [Rhodanobacter sp. 7MK24]